MKKIILGILALIVIVGGGLLLWRGKNGSTTTYRTEPLARGDVQETVNASGTINPVTTVQVGTQVSGRVIELHADFNSVVKRGQVIARIDPEPFLAQQEQAQANRLVAQANLEKAEAQVQDAEIKLRRARELYRQNLVSQDDLDTARVATETARAQVSASKAQLVQAEASVKLARTNLGYTAVVSPVDGMVVSRTVDVGQTVAASFQTPTLFSIAQDLTRMQISASVDEADIGRVEEGQAVVFTVDAYPDREFKGRVTQVRNAPVIVQNVVTYDVIIAVDNSDLKLKPGMTASTSVVVARAEGVLKVPNAALRVKIEMPKGAGPSRGSVPGAPGGEDRPAGKAAGGGMGRPAGGPQGPVPPPPGERKPEGRGRGPMVWTLEQGRPAPVPFRPGITDGAFTEVADGELREGQEVIVEVRGNAPARPRSGSPMGMGRPH